MVNLHSFMVYVPLILRGFYHETIRFVIDFQQLVQVLGIHNLVHQQRVCR